MLEEASSSASLPRLRPPGTAVRLEEDIFVCDEKLDRSS